MMVAHGITSAMMFFVVGVVYDRAHHRELSRLGGLATTMPVYTGFSTVACFANLGLPGLCGFVGEVMVLLGSFQAARGDSVLISGGHARRGTIYPLAIIACFGVVLTAGYMLWTVQRVFLGPGTAGVQGLPGSRTAGDRRAHAADDHGDPARRAAGGVLLRLHGPDGGGDVQAVRVREDREPGIGVAK